MTQKMQKAILGIDPGNNGGLAVIWPNGAECFKMPDTKQDLFLLLGEIKDKASLNGWDLICYYEKQWGKTGDTPMTAFSLGYGFGAIETALYACGIPKKPAVAAITWEKHYNTPKMDYKQRKKWLKSCAQGLFPELGKKVTDKTADALLIARYGKDKEKSD